MSIDGPQPPLSDAELIRLRAILDDQEWYIVVNHNDN